MTWASLGEAFLAQNELAAQTLTLEEVEQYADHHAGGLIVLWGMSAIPNHSVKMHDSWSDTETVVVHDYDRDDPDKDFLWEFEDGRTAFEFFLRRLG